MRRCVAALVVAVSLSLGLVAVCAVGADESEPSGRASLHLPESRAGHYDYAAARKQWAFRPPADPAIPQVKDLAWCKTPIDRFVLAKLEEKGLKPAPPAGKATLIRRAYFDLIGLPPTPEEVDAFVHDESPDAFAKVVDHLLASPQYGQRWARHWLDVVRYTDAFDSRSVKGDTIGEGDVSNAWRYRDWVVKAFNEDLPYDQFIINQIAGDLLPSKSGDVNTDGIVATGMYVIGNWGPGDADKEKMLTDIVDDQIDVTGRAFLGLTLACARCHDHKFDPIPTSDYYGLAGIFFSSHILPDPGVKTAGSLVLNVPLAPKPEMQKRKAHEEQIASARQEIESFLDEQFARRGKEMLPDVDRYLLAAREVEQKTDGGKDAIARISAEQKLDRGNLERWVDYVGVQVHPQRQRTLLATARHNVSGMPGLEAWTGTMDAPPNVVVNTTDHAISFQTITLPPRCVSIHPGARSGVAVEWRSPITGSVSIRGQVADADASCGNGIDWAIDLFPSRGIRHLKTGSFANGERQSFGNDLNAIEVQKDQVIRLTVYPKGDYSCDTTVVELSIKDERAGSLWNLTEDILPNVHAGNPHPDRLGHSEVWSFSEVPDEPQANNPTASTPPAWGAVFGDSLEDATAMAESIRDTLVALDSTVDELRKLKNKAPVLRGSNAVLYRDLTSRKGGFWQGDKQSDGSFPPEIRGKLKEMRDSLASLEQEQKNFPPLPNANAMQEGGVPRSMYEGIRDTNIEIRGRYDQLGDKVPRHFPRLLAGDDQPAITQGSGRLPLAHWIASAENPLTARVMVNRIWQHHFGEGIVRTPNNFGKLGTPPTHPELLDYLARQFVRSGWSIKAMHRAIMLSAAYQQSSIPDPATLRADPEDLLVGWHKRQRLEAEPIRDSLLFHAGTLDLAAGGPPTREIGTHRRSLYLMTIRSERSDYRALFDAPDPNAIVDARINSTVAPQSLFLLNNPFVLAQTKAIANRALTEGPANDRGRIEWLYRRLYSRAPTDQEIAIGLDAVKEAQKPEDGSPPLSREAAWDSYCQVLTCANEFVYVD